MRREWFQEEGTVPGTVPCSSVGVVRKNRNLEDAAASPSFQGKAAPHGVPSSSVGI
jgi:hypothetical protein